MHTVYFRIEREYVVEEVSTADILKAMARHTTPSTPFPAQKAGQSDADYLEVITEHPAFEDVLVEWTLNGVADEQGETIETTDWSTEDDDEDDSEE